MLYYSGTSQHLGDVDTGDTVMDFMDMERERGITINSAAITLKWKKHTINVIDTPGHVDFTMEVERSVRVLDGAVTILDAVSGVQAQTETVWRQAVRYNVPSIIFINKMDREGASFNNTLASIESRLYAKIFPAQIPCGVSRGFYAVVDLITMEQINWVDEEGWEMERTEIKDPSVLARAKTAREKLIDSLAEVDETFMDLCLDDPASITNEQVKAALRRVSIERKGVVVLCGSSLKNKGVQPILDAVIDYLPSPQERPDAEAVDELNKPVAISPKSDGKLCALAFKVVHDEKKGMLTYLRIYSGKLKPAEKIYNANVKESEKAMKIFRVLADDMESLSEINTGDIAAVIGLKHTRTGDTLVASNDPHPVRLKGLNIPQPVFFLSILPENQGCEPELNQALRQLQMEDPSVKVSFNKETGQQLISGMGELHMETVKHRILNHYKAKAIMGDLYIAYRSSVDTDGLTREFSKTFTTASGKPETATITLTIKQNEEGSNVFTINPNLDISRLVGQNNKKLAQDIRDALEDGANDAFSNGYPSGFPFNDIHVEVEDIQYISGTSATTFRNVMSQGILELAKEGGTSILEPIMNISIQVSSDQLRSVLSDLTGRRRGSINEMNQEKHLTLLSGRAPLKELLGYATDLRSMTKGTGFFSMELGGYDAPDQKIQETILREHGHFFAPEYE
eukprot:TRINITY_DN5050_c0_g1_i1.p1 TRINITY_DN5050_c0_g1~~TRINITY_DN5050_c0_g1_i1.p1  ORF type:complete len:684 (-),score=149.11 TRINITY_DN5050_c0_g1_i1:18-2069(-)